jgi:arabinose-5-phosphate isomerase
MDKARTIDIEQDQAAFAQQVLATEAAAIGRIVIDGSFGQAVDLILAAGTPGAAGVSPEPSGAAVPPVPPGAGNVVVCGMGKSGLIGAKLSATFASTGTPSHFLHPTEAMHGDLGRVRRGDVVVVLSFGGNTEEVVALASLLKQDAAPMIAIVGKAQCDLGRLATVTLAIGDVTEACPLNLAPTASTTAMLSLGDALALAVSRRRNFSVEDFRRMHPGGGLGRQLMPVIEAMRFKAGDNLPLLRAEHTVEAAYAEAEQFAQASGLRRSGALLIVDEAGKLTGIVTDGDLRTALIRSGSSAWAGPINNIMTHNPTTLLDDARVRDAVHVVREHRFDEIPIVNAVGEPVGLIDVQDLATLKVIEG